MLCVKSRDVLLNMGFNHSEDKQNNTTDTTDTETGLFSFKMAEMGLMG